MIKKKKASLLLAFFLVTKVTNYVVEQGNIEKFNSQKSKRLTNCYK